MANKVPLVSVVEPFSSAMQVNREKLLSLRQHARQTAERFFDYSKSISLV